MHDVCADVPPRFVPPRTNTCGSRVNLSLINTLEVRLHPCVDTGSCRAALFQCPAADQGREDLTTVRRRAKQDTASRREVEPLISAWSADAHE